MIATVIASAETASREALWVWLLVFYALGVVVSLLIGKAEAENPSRAWSTDASRRNGARLVILAPVWPLWVLFGLWLALRGFGRWIGRMWRLADWI